MGEGLERLKHGDPDFTGEALNRLVIEIEAAVGMHQAGMTPLGRAVIRLCEDASRADQIGGNVPTDLERLAKKIGVGGEVIVQLIPDYIKDFEQREAEAHDNHQSGTAIYWNGLARLFRAMGDIPEF